MNFKIFIAISLLYISCNNAPSTISLANNEEKEYNSDGMEEDLKGRDEWMKNMLANPATGEIPIGIRNMELAFANKLPQCKMALNKTNNMGFWSQRGPYNIGGRTRAIAIDKTNEKILLAGGASGGIWRSYNEGASWSICTNIDSNVNVTCITQDTRKGKENIWYAGTGEYFGGYVPGAFYTGNGMLKSTDSGKTWNRLKTTISSSIQFDNLWDFTNNVAINPTIDSIDAIFAATYGGIWRSLNGGNTWQLIRGSTSASAPWTDVAITPTGVIYATLSTGSSFVGIWRSTNNGSNWTKISPTFFPTNCGRISIGISPSDEKQVYFIANTPGTGKKSIQFNGTEEYNSLWKYTYVSGDGALAGGVWEDRSANLPQMQGEFGPFISQSGYCLYVKVKPDNADIVYVGGANLYRSTDGFKTTSNTAWIGGYEVGTTRPDFKIYQNHHPDNHNMVFYNSNPSKCISVHDGGISQTENNLATNVDWKSLNNGYNTTQFYTVAIDKTTTSDIVLGGLQDNGTLYTNSGEYSKPWTQPLSYDGSFCFVSPNADDYYMSIQEGRAFRIQVGANGLGNKFARIDPKNLPRSKYQFINPFTPDANNFYRIYIPNGDRIWRNNDVKQIPLLTKLDSNAVLTNWDELLTTKLSDSTDEITAITSSKIDNDVVYYGTQKGKLYRIKSASIGQPTIENISGTNFPAAYINCITTHPSNPNILFTTFTNYGILSLFQSTNAGQTWQAISGNLEEIATGAGNGPSLRWLTVVTVADSLIYYVGTSAGLFATDSLKGMQTIWVRQSPDKIGSNIVTMMDFRDTDGLLAVATYGAGVFTSIINSTKDKTMVKEVWVDHISVYPNPVNNKLFVDLFNHQAKDASYKLYDLNGKMIAEGVLENYISTENLEHGIYFVRLNIDNKIITKKIVKL